MLFHKTILDLDRERMKQQMIVMMSCNPFSDGKAYKDIMKQLDGNSGEVNQVSSPEDIKRLMRISRGRNRGKK